MKSFVIEWERPATQGVRSDQVEAESAEAAMAAFVYKHPIRSIRRIIEISGNTSGTERPRAGEGG